MNPPEISQYAPSWTPRTIQDDGSDLKTLLVAWNVHIHEELHSRMCGMPKEQSQHAPYDPATDADKIHFDQTIHYPHDGLHH